MKKIFVNDNFSILEYIYLSNFFCDDLGNSLYSLVNTIEEADIIINNEDELDFYDKTLIINNDNVNYKKLEELAKYNKVISRFPLPGDVLINYTLEPYLGLSKLPNFAFNGKSKSVLSKLSMKDFVITKRKNEYLMQEPFMYTHKQVRNHLTMIGLLDSFILENNA